VHVVLYVIFSSLVKLSDSDAHRARFLGAQLHRWSYCTTSGADSTGWYRTDLCIIRLRRTALTLTS
jgi:hypothetical protein